MRLISILGQTCSGKSQMAVDLAKKLPNSIVVNCDSRQIYQKLNIGTAKIEGEWIDGQYIYQGVKHFLIDYVDPVKYFTLAEYISDFADLINNLDNTYENIILTGGTGLYAKAIIEKYDIGVIKPEFNNEFQKTKKIYQEKSLQELQLQYTKTVDQNKLNNSDFYNPRRLVAKIVDKIAKDKNWVNTIQFPNFDSSINFAIKVDQSNLYKKITQRVVYRANQGLLAEVESLQYLGRNRIIDFGLEYRITQEYMEKPYDKEIWIDQLSKTNIDYSKRQLTWLKKQDINWIENIDNLLLQLS